VILKTILSVLKRLFEKVFHFTLKHRNTSGSTTSPIVLQPLTLSANTITENSISGTVVGAVQGLTAGSDLILSNDAGGRFAYVAGNIVAGVTPTDYETATSHTITLIESLTGATGSPKSNSLTISVTNVFEKSSLGTLTLSSTSFTNGVTSSGSINGATSGSTISITGAPTGFTINSAARTWVFDGTGGVSSGTLTLTETLADSPNSPKTNTIGYTIGGTIRAGTLTQTTSAGTNPPEWDALLPDLQDGDTIELYYTTDGSTPTATGTPQGSITYDARQETVNWGTSWPNPFPGGVTVKWMERYGRIVSGVMTWSPISNVLSDTMPSSGVVFTPQTPPAGQTTNSTTHTFTSQTFGAGIAVVEVGAFFTNSVTLTPTGGGTPITLNLLVDIEPSRRDVTVWGSSSAISAGTYDVAVGHSSANNTCAICVGTVTGATSATPASTFGQTSSVSSTDYTASVTCPTGSVWIAVAEGYDNTISISWSGGTPTTDGTVHTGGSTVGFAHGTTGGAVHATPSPGAFGAFAGVVFH
jgi:hypothetical protein